jgi:hypothetical protein
MKLLRELLEQNITEATKEFTSKAEVQTWIDKKRRTVFQYVNPNQQLTVSDKPPYKIDCHAVFFKNAAIFKKPLPVHFGNVSRYTADDCAELTDLAQLNVDVVYDLLSVSNARIRTLKNCPDVKLKLDASHSELISLEGCSKNVEELSLSFCKEIDEIDVELPKLKRLTMPASGITTLHNIHIMCPKLKFIQINSSTKLKSSILCLLKCPDLRPGNIISNTNDNSWKTEPATHALKIMKRLWEDGHDIFDVQEALINAGLDDFAQL